MLGFCLTRLWAAGLAHTVTGPVGMWTKALACLENTLAHPSTEMILEPCLNTDDVCLNGAMI